jgi:hypothetical protein
MRFRYCWIAFALPLLADDLSQDRVSSTHTERFNVSAAGAIRLENSFGQMDIEGWDRPEVEVTVVRSSVHLYDAKQRTEAQAHLETAQITAKQNGNDVVISTAYPPRNWFMRVLSGRGDIEIGYRIKAPHASKLIIDHHSGGLIVSNFSGDIHATVGDGQITLALAAGGQFAIDAQCKVGDVYSDLEGHAQRRHAWGKEFESPSTASAANLYLRVRYGDIMIWKLQGPPAGGSGGSIVAEPPTGDGR